MKNIRINTKKCSGKTPLFIRLRIGKKSYWVNLQMDVDVKRWEECSTDKRKENYLKLLGYKSKLDEIGNTIDLLRTEEDLSIDIVKEVVSSVVMKEDRDKLLKLKEHGDRIKNGLHNNVCRELEKYVNGIDKGELRNNKGETYKKNSKNIIKQFLRVFKGYYNKYPFTWNDVNQTLINSMITYFEKEGYMRSSYVRYVTSFKTFMTYTLREGIHNNTIYKTCVIPHGVKEEDKLKEIYLTKEELDRLYEMKLSGKEKEVRDLFLIGCYTGQRFSDYSRIDSSCIGKTSSGTMVIRLTQKKTGQKVVIPIIDERLLLLLKEYDYNVPSVCDVVFNRYIKSICKELSNTTPSLQRKERTNLTKKERDNYDELKGTLFEIDNDGYPIKPRYQLVSSHTARRTCITNMFLSKKYTLPQMMSISGHRKEETFKMYVKLSFDEMAEDFAKSTTDGTMF